MRVKLSISCVKSLYILRYEDYDVTVGTFVGPCRTLRSLRTFDENVFTWALDGKLEKTLAYTAVAKSGILPVFQ